MENIYLMPVYQPEPYCPALPADSKTNECINIRFFLNLINPQMQRMTLQLGYHNFCEMVDAYDLKGELPQKDIQGNLELLCDILYDEWCNF